LAAMTYEMCREIVASGRLHTEAGRLRDELAHVARVSTLSELSGSLAHELNQPLGAILRNAEAAQMLLAAEQPDLGELRAIVSDRVQVSQVLLNLLVNGIDAVSESRAPARRVALEMRQADERTVEVAVTDSGDGIAADMLTKVFEPFVTTKATGMGIGLAVSR